MHKCHCKDNCDTEDREECGNLCNRVVGTATSHIVEPVNLQRDKRIEAKKKLMNLKARDQKEIKGRK